MRPAVTIPTRYEIDAIVTKRRRLEVSVSYSTQVGYQLTNTNSKPNRFLDAASIWKKINWNSKFLWFATTTTRIYSFDSRSCWAKSEMSFISSWSKQTTTFIIDRSGTGFISARPDFESGFGFWVKMNLGLISNRSKDDYGFTRPMDTRQRRSSPPPYRPAYQNYPPAHTRDPAFNRGNDF